MPYLPPPTEKQADLLRARAEERLRNEPMEAASLTAEQVLAVIHELHVHQIELETQNEQLRTIQQELEAARGRYFELYDLAPVGYLTLSEQGVITAANLTSPRLLGIECAQMDSVPFSSFLLGDEEDQNAYYFYLRRVFASPEIQTCEVRLRSKGGAVSWARLQGVQASEDGAPVCRLTLADITREKEAEELLASRAKQLEGLVQERTGKLQEAVNELEHFSYTLAHDLRAPLRAVRGFSDLLLAQATNLSPAHRRFLERSGTAVERMDQLVTDALNYNRLVRQNVALEPVDCRALIEELIESYPQFQEARAAISIFGNIPPVLGNPALLTQCFSNLLNNALKFIAPGQVPKVRIFAQDMDPRVRIWVEDNGIGIPEDYREKIFEMFQRLSADYDGTGIGLALVKKAVERMHGAVGVESRPGHGSRFWVELDKAVRLT